MRKKCICGDWLELFTEEINGQEFVTLFCMKCGRKSKNFNKKKVSQK